MKTDQVVEAKDVLRALAEVKRRGNTQVMEELERQEPDLMEQVIEELSGIHQMLLEAGIVAKRVRRIARRMEAVVIVTIDALRRGQRRLWEGVSLHNGGDGAADEASGSAESNPMPSSPDGGEE